ncbi:hypothetical protein Tco_0659130 [Tanacetum coccineum]
MSTKVHQAAETVTTSNELDLLFGLLFDKYFNRENQVVLKSSAVTTTDASNKRQQPDSTSSTSTLATTVTTNRNFDLEEMPTKNELTLEQSQPGVSNDDLGEALKGLKMKKKMYGYKGGKERSTALHLRQKTRSTHNPIENQQ